MVVFLFPLLVFNCMVRGLLIGAEYDRTHPDRWKVRYIACTKQESLVFLQNGKWYNTAGKKVKVSWDDFLWVYDSEGKSLV